MCRTFFNPELHLVPSQVYFCLSLGNHKNLSVVDFQKGQMERFPLGFFEVATITETEVKWEGEALNYKPQEMSKVEQLPPHQQTRSTAPTPQNNDNHSKHTCHTKNWNSSISIYKICYYCHGNFMSYTN